MKIFLLSLISISCFYIRTGYAGTCNVSAFQSAIQQLLTSPQRLYNCSIEFQKIQSDNSNEIFFQIFAIDHRTQNLMGIDVWSEQDCEFRYNKSQNTYTYTDTKFFGPLEQRRQIQIKVNSVNNIDRLLLRSFNIKPYKIIEQADCRSHFFGEYDE